ncbi:substrate-binding domain-containing protein [Aminobacter ciceronei]|uniref:Molybdate transport repressor ModE-like protein n=1 Tax=Aminobacter ciceronei TaxID=150723 RepID=A0ABR6CA07_9HYPH|nr:substrate-binding domain-containing protein [Aminobacter ciceronei]MBA8907961.1 molybdate transport repressor ModE-like protein [Aminobacter ciceronei]MBA9021716.1 molybdate transport repressor ModE-like protein [Aminobacter ciceronei]
MIQVEIEPVWRFKRREDSRSLRIMLDFLAEIRTTGKLTSAADRAEVSYRHAWNLIEKWSEFFDMPLVVRKQGSGTQLTPFGDKLVWAGQRLEARLRPLLQNLSQELETEINQMLPRGPLVLRVHASHGFAVPKLRDLLSREPDIDVDFRYVSNQSSLASLAHDGCDLAGMHLPQGELRRRVIAASKGWLTPSAHRVIGFVTREVGLIVAQGNPHGITSINQLPDGNIRFVNRDPDSGTRQLFEHLLAQQKIDGTRINGYEHAEFTHAAVAAYVASGMADVAFGVEAAAAQFGLDFVRVLTEDYFFVCRKDILEVDAVRRVLEVMRSSDFYDAISRIPGYRVKDAGMVKTIGEVFRRSE